MSRTSVEKVQNVLPLSTALECDQISAAIDAATALVDELVALMNPVTLSDAVLLQVETYLSAHFAAATENSLALRSESSPCGSGRATYGFDFGDGIMGTPYGQMANTLSGGWLQEFDKRPVKLLSIGSIGC